MLDNIPSSGLGDSGSLFKVYIANRPNFADYRQSHSVTSMSKGEVEAIGNACGNGWRKVFNVYAKVVFALNLESLVPLKQAKTWQEFRDMYLLQSGSGTCLLFSSPELNVENTQSAASRNIHIIMGKTYAKTLGLSLNWLDNDFAINLNTGVIVCPYFDYRQLSNIKIVRLVELVKQLSVQVNGISNLTFENLEFK